jgi:hypothetical protein
MAGVPVDERTAIVTVEEVVEAPDSFTDYLGAQITVLLAGRQRIEPGQELVFHAVPWMYGDSLAVRSLRQEATSAARAAAIGQASPAAAHPVDRHLQSRLAQADLVVAGKVKEVRMPPAAAAKDGVAPISEHGADWREAVIEVANVLKGRHTRKSVVVRFPASTDVRWHQVPKLEPGQEGYFLLHRTEAEPAGPRRRAREKRAGASAAAVAGYAVLDPDDFQVRGAGIEALVK